MTTCLLSQPQASQSPQSPLSQRSQQQGARKRVLFVAYQFPPVGGAGVQRTAKFVKHLPPCGWLPSVLTVANPSVPLFDESLAAEVPGGTLIRRARTLEPGYALKSSLSAKGDGGRRGMGRLLRGTLRRLGSALLQPDPQILWLPAAVREGMRLLEEVPHAAIVATGPPFSGLLVGAALSRRTGLPLILDYRDEWGLSNAYSENKRPGFLSRFIQRRMQRWAVRSAKALLATTRTSATALETVCAEAGGSARVGWIYNGYDPEDFPAAAPAPRSAEGVYRLAYVGTLWNLTSVEPLVEAVRDLARRRPDLAGRLELVFAGRRTGAQEEILGRLNGLPCRVVTHPYLNHRAATELTRSADGLCVLLSAVPGADRVVPAKVFECMAARRPVVAIAPRGEVWDLLQHYPAGHLFEPGDVGAISACLAAEIQRASTPGTLDFNGWDGTKYARPSQARQLAELLESLT
jgi:glycosyltransferase involved in cell wall biosynthesis